MTMYIGYTVLSRRDHQFFSNFDFCLFRMTSHTWSNCIITFLPDDIYISTTERTIYKHIQVYLLAFGLVKNVLCVVLLFLKHHNFIIFLNLRICGRLLGLPCKLTMSKHYCFKKLETSRFQSFLKVCILSSKFNVSCWLCCIVETNYHVSLSRYFFSHSIGNLDQNWFTDT